MIDYIVTIIAIYDLFQIVLAPQMNNFTFALCPNAVEKGTFQLFDDTNVTKLSNY